MIGDGVKLEFNGSFSSVRLCLDLGSFATRHAFSVSEADSTLTISLRYPSLNVKEFPLVDIAESNSSGVYPLNLLMDIESDGFCGTVAVVRGTVYVPVLHKNKWESAQPVGLSRGEKVRSLPLHSCIRKCNHSSIGCSERLRCAVSDLCPLRSVLLYGAHQGARLCALSHDLDLLAPGALIDR